MWNKKWKPKIETQILNMIEKIETQILNMIEEFTDRLWCRGEPPPPGTPREEIGTDPWEKVFEI